MMQCFSIDRKSGLLHGNMDGCERSERASERTHALVSFFFFLSLGGFAPLPCRALPFSRSFILRKAAGRGSCIA